MLLKLRTNVQLKVGLCLFSVSEAAQRSLLKMSCSAHAGCGTWRCVQSCMCNIAKLYNVYLYVHSVCAYSCPGWGKEQMPQCTTFHTKLDRSADGTCRSFGPRSVWIKARWFQWWYPNIQISHGGFTTAQVLKQRRASKTFQAYSIDTSCTSLQVRSCFSDSRGWVWVPCLEVWVLQPCPWIQKHKTI